MGPARRGALGWRVITSPWIPLSVQGSERDLITAPYQQCRLLLIAASRLVYKMLSRPVSWACQFLRLFSVSDFDWHPGQPGTPSLSEKTVATA